MFTINILTLEKYYHNISHKTYRMRGTGNQRKMTFGVTAILSRTNTRCFKWPL